MIHWLNHNEGFASAALAFALLVVTAFSALVTHLTRNDSRRSQFGAEMAITGGSISLGENKVMFSASNIGRGPAYHIAGTIHIGDWTGEMVGPKFMPWLAGTAIDRYVGGTTFMEMNFYVPEEQRDDDGRLLPGTKVRCLWSDRFGRHETTFHPAGS